MAMAIKRCPKCRQVSSVSEFYRVMDEKVCSRCKQTKSTSEFYRNKGWRDGYHPWCKSCFSEACRAQYERRCAKTPPKYRWHRNEVRHDFFANVTTPLQAYLLGFLAADGNVLAPLNRISVELSTKDLDLLTLIRNTLAPGHQLRKRTRCASDKRYGSGESCTLSFTSARMVQDLARYGIVPAKTLHLRWPSLLPTEMARDFLLGYFDGDGHITHTVSFGIRYGIWGITAGSPDFLRDVIAFVRNQTGIVLRGPHQKATSARSYTIRITGSGAVRIDQWIHESGLGLLRKRLSI
ncbi:MAG: hypothetical protein C5B60_10040 [Chloroflexi bacterium]|nr:MAG: hypothetical protein C5B60_10040 [Chloroflexota bacterium]